MMLNEAERAYMDARRAWAQRQIAHGDLRIAAVRYYDARIAYQIVDEIGPTIVERRKAQNDK